MTKKNKKKNKGLNIFFNIVAFILIILSVVTAGVIVYFEILPILYLILCLLILAFLAFLFVYLLRKNNLRVWVKNIILIVSLLYSFILIFINAYAMGTLDFLNNIIDTGYRSETYELYVLNNSYKDVKELEGKTIGLYNLKDEYGKKAIDKLSSKIAFNASYYEDLQAIVDALINKEIDAVLMSKSYMDIMIEQNSDYINLINIYSFDILIKEEIVESNIDVTKESFVFYISGIDTKGKIGTKSRSDVNILVAVNPKSGKILMLNTPRDYYVTLNSYGKKDKLTHAGLYGVEESLKTLEDLYDVDIAYYARVNFTSFVTIVNELGGIKVDVPVSFCEQDSNRDFNNQICLKKGMQTLNGEEALALTRTRHTISGGDRGRIANQLLVLNGIIDKALSPSIIVKYNSLLKSLSNYVTTNMDKDSLVKFIKEQIKDPKDFSMEQITVIGSDSSNTTYSTGSAKVYVMEIDEESINSAKLALKSVLEG